MNKDLSLSDLSDQIESFKDSLPPVHSWQPDVDAEMDLEIRTDGSWVHEGGVIERQPLIKLLASVMRREDDGRYALVTPRERVFIRVVDAPFLIVDWSLIDSDEGQQLTLESNLGEQVIVNQQNPLWLKGEDAQPYVMVRPGLAGRFTRSAYYRLADILEEHDNQWGVSSGSAFVPMQNR